jgi:hypothetical protein
MPKLRPVCKTQSITIPDKTPQKRWKKLSNLPAFSSDCCLLHHVCAAATAKLLKAADSSHRRTRATKDSREAAISQGR